MSLEGFIEDSGQQCSVLAEAPDRQRPGQTAMGGADRRDDNWLTVADGVSCLFRPQASTLDYGRNDARANVVAGRIYFASDPTPTGLTTRHRIVIASGSYPGVYAIMGVIDPNSMGRIIQADVERIRQP